MRLTKVCILFFFYLSGCLEVDNNIQNVQLLIQRLKLSRNHCFTGIGIGTKEVESMGNLREVPHIAVYLKITTGTYILQTTRAINQNAVDPTFL